MGKSSLPKAVTISVRLVTIVTIHVAMEYLINRYSLIGDKVFNISASIFLYSYYLL